MKIRSILCCFALFLCFPVATVYGDYLKVSRSATIKAEPNREATILERVSAGTYLQLLDDGQQITGYYHVERVSPGQPGWIYRTLVRRYRGEIPESVPEAQLIDPLSDPTLRLTAEQRRFAARHLRLGKPQAVYERVREGYVLAQDGRMKIPLWVQYELTPEELEGPASRDSRRFRPDASIPFGYRAEDDDYDATDLVRGHLAPAADMKRSERAMSESFLFSNAAPQVGAGFNGATWLSLENAVRGWVEQRGTLTIITGPAFSVDANIVRYRVVGDNHLAVPTHFYKIVADANDPESIETLAFMMPNQTLTGHHYSEFLCTIDEIEEATGLDFLSALPDRVQKDVESVVAPSVW